METWHFRELAVYCNSFCGTLCKKEYMTFSYVLPMKFPYFVLLSTKHHLLILWKLSKWISNETSVLDIKNGKEMTENECTISLFRHSIFTKKVFSTILFIPLVSGSQCRTEAKEVFSGISCVFSFQNCLCQAVRYKFSRTSLPKSQADAQTLMSSC